VTLDPAHPPTDPFTATGNLRQPAQALGPRAQKMIARIIDATRDVFGTRGYAGTTIDEIAQVAEVSRASFYTYFPSKREVLLAVGAHAATESEALIDRLPEHATSQRTLRDWVADYFDFLDVHGSFAFAWTQAAHDDEEIRIAGMKRHLQLCKRIGDGLTSSLSHPAPDTLTLGVVASATLERSWNYSQLYGDTTDRDRLINTVTATLWAAAQA
jgi:TetR/AcrR family transcriptional regulator